MSIEQGSEAWHQARLGRVTGSRIGPLMGLGRWATADETIAEMVEERRTGKRKSLPDNAPMAYGRASEPIALEAYKQMMFVEVADGGFHNHPDDMRFAASPDGLIGDDGGLEIKCPYKHRNRAPAKWESCKAQGQYYAQIQWCMYVTGRKWWDFFQWSANGEPHWERVERDEAFIADAVATAHRALAAVDAALADGAEIPASWSEPTETATEETATEEPDYFTRYDHAVISYEEAAAHAKARKAELDEVIALIADARGDQPWPCGTRRLVRKARAGSVSYAKVVKDHCPGVDLDPYRGAPSESWAVEDLGKGK